MAFRKCTAGIWRTWRKWRDAMLISIVTVALNAADDLPITIESVLAQDYEGREFVIVDGNSIDETHRVLSRYRNEVDAIQSVEDAGVYYAMNMSMDFVSGDFVLFLNAGDRLYQANTLSRIAARYNGAARIVYGDHIYREGSVEAFRAATDFRWIANRIRKGQQRSALDTFPAHQATLVCTEIVRQLRFDTAFRICADHDLLLRAYEQGVDFQYVDEIVAVYAGGGLSQRQSELCELEWNALYRQFTASPERTDAHFDRTTPFRGTPSGPSGSVIGGRLTGSPNADPALAIETPYRFVAASGLTIVTPNHGLTQSITVRGHNLVEGQTLDFERSGERLASHDLPIGPFTNTVTLDPPLPAASLVDVRPAGVMRTAGMPAPVSFALHAVTFDAMEEPPAHLRRSGTTLEFNRAHEHELVGIFGPGWSTLEDSFVWATGDRSQLVIATLDEVRILDLTLQPHPQPDDPAITVEVNGTEVAIHALPKAIRSTISVPVAEAWLSGGQRNRIILLPKYALPHGNDPRRLSFAVFSLTLR